MIEVIVGDLLDSKEKYIAHQCNLLTKNSAGTAKAIFDKFPYANTYINRQVDSDGKTIITNDLGTIDILGNGQDQRYVINMYAQHYPGKPKYTNSTLDGSAVREKYFYQCLLRIAKIPDLESIAFPFGIGCNLAGGNWNNYLGNLENFANYVAEKDVKVSLYRKGDK